MTEIIIYVFTGWNSILTYEEDLGCFRQIVADVRIWGWGEEHSGIQILPHSSRIEDFNSKIKQIHFWYFWEKQVSLTEFIHMSMGKQNFEEKEEDVFAWVIWI